MWKDESHAIQHLRKNFWKVFGSKVKRGSQIWDFTNTVGKVFYAEQFDMMKILEEIEVNTLKANAEWQERLDKL